MDAKIQIPLYFLSFQYQARTMAVPGAPALSGVGGIASATLSWSAPASDGGSPVTGYVLEQRAQTAGEWGPWSASASTPAMTASRTGLANGSTYEFRVSAKNAFGVGAPSASVSVVPAGAPLATAKVKLKATKGKVKITWAAAKDNGSPITGYTVQYSTNGKKWSTLKNVKAKVRTLTTKKGKKGKSVYIRVIAKNAVGKGVPSTAMSTIKK